MNRRIPIGSYGGVEGGVKPAYPIIHKENKSKVATLWLHQKRKNFKSCQSDKFYGTKCQVEMYKKS